MKSRCSGLVASRRNRSWPPPNPNSASPITRAACWSPTAATANSRSCDGGYVSRTRCSAKPRCARGTIFEPRSKAVALRPKLGFFVRRLLGNSEPVADLPPQGAGAMGARHGLAGGHAAPDRARELPQGLALGLLPRLHSFLGLLRASGIGARPALDIGSVDDPAQTPGTANNRVARRAQRFCDLGSGASYGLQRQQPFVTRWRPARFHGGRGPITMPHARHLIL